jgi:hypothetical protein
MLVRSGNGQGRRVSTRLAMRGVAMTEEDIADTVAAFAKAAADAKRLGFDTVEIHGAHGYLIEFFWAGTNLRTDRYGGPTIKERSRFAGEIVTAVRQAVGPEFPIIMRISQWKQQDFNVRLADTPAEMETWLLPMPGFVIVFIPHLQDRMGIRRAPAALHHREQYLFLFHHVAFEVVLKRDQRLREAGRRRRVATVHTLYFLCEGDQEGEFRPVGRMIPCEKMGDQRQGFFRRISSGCLNECIEFGKQRCGRQPCLFGGFRERDIAAAAKADAVAAEDFGRAGQFRCDCADGFVEGNFSHHLLLGGRVSVLS